MALGTPIKLNNQGDSIYAQTAREFLTSPIKTDMMRVILANEAQINNNIKIRNSSSFGSQSNRDISLRNFISAMNRTNLIVDIKLSPPVVLDGQTYFQTDIEANSEIDLLFYFEQKDIGDLLNV